MTALGWGLLAAGVLSAAPPEVHLSKVRWGMSRAEVRRALGLRDDAPFKSYSHFPASWEEFRASARLGGTEGFLYLCVTPSGLRMLDFRPSKRPKGMCRRDLDAARRSLEKEFGPAQERSGISRTCFEWSPSGGSSLRACCQPLIPEERPDTRIAYLSVMYLGPARPGDEPVQFPSP